MPQGFLGISVSVSDSALPIEGAKVYVMKSSLPQNGDASNRLLQYEPSLPNGRTVSPTDNDGEFITNSDGKTPSIGLDAPDANISLEENSPDIPYSIFDVYIEARGFVPVRVRGVQIYAGVDSLLPVNLHPSLGSNVNIEIYVIPENALYLSEQRNQQSAIPIPRAFPDIAERVYIPETIAVHLGRPEQQAENVYVSFPDYIKNVASSEIYPTWPDSALRANIYAQISLALNRVYTEWYPSQGYNFQITNSTAFDQAFVNGRNIFSNISAIVDEIFNSFLQREGYVEPLFAQYCDGVQTSCAGMSQWGSLYLAEQGSTPIRIVRYYYGQDVEINSTDVIMSIEESYPGSPLSVGDTSDAVATLQAQLNRISQNYPSIPLIPSITGRFGSETDAAVRAFQRIFELPVNGIVDRASWYRISYIYTAVKDLAELTSEGESPSVPSGPPNVTLRRGSTGNNVRLLQYILSYISLFYTDISPVRLIDGIFGTETLDSVISFQQSFGLQPDGIAGSETWEELYRVFDGILSTIAVQTPEQSYPGYELRRGSSSEAVRLIQIYLNVINESYPIIPGVSEDGVFGEETEIAVRAFQRRFGLADDGVVGQQTWARIIEVYNFVSRGTGVSPDANATAMSVASPAVSNVQTLGTNFPGIDLRRGQHGKYVLLLQRGINEAVSATMPQLRINETGAFDNSTENAVLVIQKALGKTPTGIVNEELWNEIFSDTANRL